MASSSLAFLPLNHQLLSKPIAKSHLQRRKLSSQNVGRFINTTSKMSISSNSHEMQRLASQHLKPVNGIHNMCKWVEECGLKRAAVTNSRRENAELMISILGLSNFFDILVIGCECMRPKPYPEPYLKALQALNVYPNHTFVFEDSVSGVKAGVAAGITVVGLTRRSSEHSLIDAGASFLIEDFNDPKLQAALKGLEMEETALV
eukprot:TRINITY_DN2115_c0_g2_i2.p2 TRINITY_DN2115_c0_g2~~TRINITY_DN2115_c0_g2_i2.p2  ORF type:complete len:204 (-),score=27.36 TRINITY_DN2115_c0_g2_i2:150-761(-)